MEKKKCKKNGCENPSYCRELCALHYQELRRTTELKPLYEKMVLNVKSVDVPKRFMLKDFVENIGEETTILVVCPTVY